MSNEQPKYQPYRPTPKDQDGINDVVENRGAGSTEPYIPNSWDDGFAKSSEREGK